MTGLTNPVGTGMYLYDNVNSKFVRVITTSGVNSWEDVPAGTFLIPASPTVRSFPLTRTYVILTITASDSLTGSAYLLATNNVNTVVDLVPSPTASTIGLRYFTDEIYNFVRLASNLMVWVTVRSSANNYFRT